MKHIKSLILAVLGTALLWTAPAQAAGTIPLAMAQQVDVNGTPLANCQVYFFVAGTVASAQNAFADFGLTQSIGPQLSCDQAGRVPMFWLADGLIHVRLTDATGVQVIDTTMQVLGPSSGGGGGGGTVDPTAILATGDMKAKYGTGPLSGFVRANALTIGNATSGATERANADTQALFIYLYGADPNLVVSGGRTGNALNDYNANKTIATPDWRGRGISGLDDMGNSPAGVLTTSVNGFGPALPTVLGQGSGTESNTLVTLNLPPYTPAGTVSAPAITNPSGSVVATNGTLGNITPAGGGSTLVPSTNTSFFAASLVASAPAFTGSAQGGTSTPFRTLTPIRLATIYLKL